MQVVHFKMEVMLLGKTLLPFFPFYGAFSCVIHTQGGRLHGLPPCFGKYTKISVRKQEMLNMTFVVTKCGNLSNAVKTARI